MDRGFSNKLLFLLEKWFSVGVHALDRVRNILFLSSCRVEVARRWLSPYLFAVGLFIDSLVQRVQA